MTMLINLEFWHKKHVILTQQEHNYNLCSKNPMTCFTFDLSFLAMSLLVRPRTFLSFSSSKSSTSSYTYPRLLGSMREFSYAFCSCIPNILSFPLFWVLLPPFPPPPPPILKCNEFRVNIGNNLYILNYDKLGSSIQHMQVCYLNVWHT